MFFWENLAKASSLSAQDFLSTFRAQTKIIFKYSQPSRFIVKSSESSLEFLALEKILAQPSNELFSSRNFIDRGATAYPQFSIPFSLKKAFTNTQTYKFHFLPIGFLKGRIISLLLLCCQMRQVVYPFPQSASHLARLGTYLSSLQRVT